MGNIKSNFRQKSKREERLKKAKEALQQVGLGHRLTHLPKELSGGEQQRVAIARALVEDPAFVLADEPTGNLDSENSNLISKILFDYVKEENSSLLMVTHDQNLANQTNRKIKTMITN